MVFTDIFRSFAVNTKCQTGGKSRRNIDFSNDFGGFQACDKLFDPQGTRWHHKIPVALQGALNSA